MCMVTLPLATIIFSSVPLSRCLAPFVFAALGAVEDAPSCEPKSKTNGSVKAVSAIFNIVFVPSDYSSIRKARNLK